MSVEKIIASLPEKSSDDRQRIVENARRLSQMGTEAQRADASRLLSAVEELERNEQDERVAWAERTPISERVVAAFKADPMTDNERKTVMALLDNPGSTTTELSRICGNAGMIWQMHFGNLCKDRQAYLWPAEKAQNRDGLFFSGILADIDHATNRFTMKPEVANAFAALGLKAASR